MNASAYKTLFRDLGFTSLAHGKKLRHPNDPPTLYFNVSRSGEVYFTGRRTERDLFPQALWVEIAAHQKKDRDPHLVTFVPVAGKEAAAFRDLVTRSAAARRKIGIKEEMEQPKGIPSGITETDVRQAAKDIDANQVEDTFGESRLWDVMVDGRLYPPKRLLGVAARRVAGRVLRPNDFSGGEDSKCHEILENLGFEIVSKGALEERNDAEEREIESHIHTRTDITKTTRDQLIRARNGQGRFRRNVAAIEKKGCRVSGVTDMVHLRASHIKPWKVCDDQEKLDGSNGLLLAPHIDHLFDRGYISFTDCGQLLVSKHLRRKILDAWGVSQPAEVGPFQPAQCRYLDYHRHEVYKK